MEPESDPVTDGSSFIYAEKSTPAPPNTQENFEDLVKAFCDAILDLLDKNPVSRLPSSTLKNLEGVKNDVINMHKILIPRKPQIKTQ